LTDKIADKTRVRYRNIEDISQDCYHFGFPGSFLNGK